VRDARVDVGTALDGNADRVVIAEAKGRIVDGDQIMFEIAKRHLKEMGLALVRTPVGDRYVVEHIRKQATTSAAISRAESCCPLRLALDEGASHLICQWLQEKRHGSALYRSDVDLSRHAGHELEAAEPLQLRFR
jgi:phosphomannomutase